MSNIKKIIGVVLALVMALSVTTIAFAAAGDTYSVTVTADKTTLAAGESATVTVSVTTNYNVSTMSIPVFFDKTLVTVSEATTGLTGDLKDVAIVTDGENIDKFYKGSGYAVANYGVLALTYIAKDGAAIETYTNTTVMTFKVTALADVSGNAVVGCAPGTVKTSTNTTGTLYVGKNSSGSEIVDSSAEVIDTADLTAATTTITIGGGGAIEVPNTLVIKDTFEHAADMKIDKDIIGVYLEWYAPDYSNATDASATGLVYGADVFEYVLEDVLTTTLGDEYLRLTRTAAADGYDSTGTKIEVLDADGSTVLETYYYVYFGDINCDGVMDTSDISACVTAINTNAPYESIAQFIAADYNADTYTDTLDISAFVKAFNQSESANQGELAATFYEGYQSQLS